MLLTDPLKDKPVAIGVQVLPGGDDFMNRPILLTLAADGQRPTMRPGTLGNLQELVLEVWREQSLMVMAPVTTPADSGDEDEDVVIAEAELTPRPAAAAQPGLYSDDDF